jgi:arylsulfatase A-like enzyme
VERSQSGAGRRLAAGAWLLSLALACSPPPPAARPDILLITLDTFRYDRPGYAGYEPQLTPALDALAAESAIFEQAVTSMATTFPAHATILTGQPPSRHGVRWNGDGLSAGAITLGEVLHHYGYETAAFVSYKLMIAAAGLGQGFETRSDSVLTSHADIRADPEVTELALEWLTRRRGERPFFAWVHYFGAHSPYLPTPHARERMAGYDGFLADGVEARELHRSRREILGSPEHRAALQALYDGNALAVDREVGRLLAALDRTDRGPETVIVLTADHGQALGERGAIGHGGLLLEVAVRVPLLIRTPDGCAGCRVGTRVGLEDLAPTLLELAGVAAPPRLPGRSLVPAIRGGDLSDRPYVVETKGRPVGDRVSDGGSPRAVYLGPYKLVDASEGVALYDVSGSAGEGRKLEAGAHPAVVGRARGHLDAYARGEVAPPSTDVGDLTPERVEELRALGYVE